MESFKRRVDKQGGVCHVTILVALFTKIRVRTRNTFEPGAWRDVGVELQAA